MHKTFAALVLCVATAAQAQFPARNVTIVVPFPAGGSTDIAARVIAPKLAERWAHPVIVENKAGAGGNIGAHHVVKAQPDGHVLLLGTTALAISPSISAKLPYDPIRDLAPVTMVSTIPNILVVNPAVKATTIEEFIALARREPGRLNFAAPGPTSAQRMTFELIKQVTGTDIVMIPYQGGAPAMQAVLAGEVHAMIVNVVEAVKFVVEGKLRALAATTAKRAPMLPHVPTLAETVAPGLDTSVWQAVFVPAATPAALIAKLNADLGAVLALPDVKERLHGLGMNVVPGTPQALGAFVAEEIERWRNVARAAQIEPQ